MIKLTKIGNKKITINSDLIETIESNPDTTITMTTGKKIICTESVDEIIDKVIDFKKNIYK